jgi:two-component system sensor histidine kinase QseC
MRRPPGRVIVDRTMNGRSTSLQGRMLAVVLGIVLAGGISGSIASYMMAVQTADELFDAQLAQAAQTLLSIVEKGDDQVVYNPPESAHRYQQKLMFQVWELVRGEFRLVLRSENAPAELLPAAADHVFTTADWNDRSWRFYAEVDDHHDTRVIVAQDIDVRRQLASSIAWQNLLPFSIGVPLLAVLLLLAIRRSLRPLSALANELRNRAPNRLDPLQIADPPMELQPVLKGLDELFGKVAASLENERRFTADAAHELRTPLAGLKVQLQVAMRTSDPVEQRRAHEKCMQGIASMTHLVQQALTLTRVEASSHTQDFEKVDIAPLAASVCRDMGADAAAKQVALEVDLPRSAIINGLPEMLRIMLRNLLDNAVRYTPECGHVTVGITGDATTVRLEITDSGPGVPSDQLELLGCRFHRLGESVEDGVGLGLSIVKRIANIHAAELVFSVPPPGAGLRATISFPAEGMWCAVPEGRAGAA